MSWLSKFFGRGQSQAQNTLIVTEVIAGQKLAHDGPIVFKVYVPDGVEAVSRTGGIVLEKGGGDNLSLKAERDAGGGAVCISSSSGSVSVVSSGYGNKVIVNGKDISDRFNAKANKADIVGITCRCPIGKNASLSCQAFIEITDAGDGLKATCGGSISAGQIGDQAALDAGGSCSMGSIGASGRIDAGGSVNVHEIGSATVVDAGGSINCGLARSGARLDAGGSITLGACEDGVRTDAGGSVRVAGRKMSF